MGAGAEERAALTDEELAAVAAALAVTLEGQGPWRVAAVRPEAALATAVEDAPVRGAGPDAVAAPGAPAAASAWALAGRLELMAQRRAMQVREGRR